MEQPLIKSFVGSRGGFSKEPLAAGGPGIKKRGDGQKESNYK